MAPGHAASDSAFAPRVARTASIARRCPVHAPNARVAKSRRRSSRRGESPGVTLPWLTESHPIARVAPLPALIPIVRGSILRPVSFGSAFVRWSTSPTRPALESTRAPSGIHELHPFGPRRNRSEKELQTARAKSEIRVGGAPRVGIIRPHRRSSDRLTLPIEDSLLPRSFQTTQPRSHMHYAPTSSRRAASGFEDRTRTQNRCFSEVRPVRRTIR